MSYDAKLARELEPGDMVIWPEDTQSIRTIVRVDPDPRIEHSLIVAFEDDDEIDTQFVCPETHPFQLAGPSAEPPLKPDGR